MQNFSSVKRKTLGPVAAVAALTLAASVAAVGTAQAAVKVTVTGTVSCAKFKDSVPKTITITPKKGTTDTDELPGDDKVERYTIKLTGIPNNGTTANIKVVCEDDEGDLNTYKFKSLSIKKPGGNAALTINLS